MGFRLAAIFTHNTSLEAKALQQWPGCYVKEVKKYHLLGIAAHPDLTFQATKEDKKRALRMKKELPAWSSQFPDDTFVFIEVNCHGGDCLNEGYAVKNQKLLHKQEPSAHGHQELLTYLGITLDKQYFVAFTDGFFE
ncbi:hypothetical protein GF342_01165 [Candidatus Woesearchaeota archaeon]|nr:hypothetical protein [Candidatus Woesearchaeota archaeon]